MNYVDYRFSLDVQEIGSQVFMTVKQGDTNRRLIINLTEGHEPYAIALDCVAVFAATKADGNVIFNNAVIEGNNIIYDFTEQTVAAVGNMRCEIQLYGEDNKLLCSPNFTIAVLPSQVGGNVESLTEVNTLTRLIGQINMDLASGAYVPDFRIGIVETLPTGSNATATITGTSKNPFLNLGLPAGPVGPTAGFVLDAELSTESTNPIQNKPVAEKFEQVDESFEDVNTELSNLAKDKVTKEDGKGLSTNDFTAEEKEKLAGIEAGANKFVLNDGAVTAEKIAAGAVSRSVAVVLPAASWANNAQTVNVAAVTADNTVIVSPAPAADNYAAYTDNAVRCTAQAAGTLIFVCESVPDTDVTVNVTLINK